jgi:hypothetical protein
MDKDILQFQKDCFANYINDIRKLVPEIPKPYMYPDGNPVRPVIPVRTNKNSIMLIGAFPSARFERRNKLLIPTGDNLSPFGYEEYFDGTEVRTQASRDSLDKNYFQQLKINPEKIWITDIVKIYLFPDKHIKNCKVIAPKIKFVNIHKLFSEIAGASMEWMTKEIKICNPQLIITLGEVPARIISKDKKTPNEKLLNGEIREINLDKKYRIAHLGHPEIRRINKNWDKLTEQAIVTLAKGIEQLQIPC